MAPSPVLNASSALSPTLNPLHLPQPAAFQLGGFNQNQWGPDAIGTIFFGVVMFFIGVNEEQGRRANVGGRPADLAEEFAMVELGSERVAVGVDEQPRGEDDAMEEGFVKIERGIRTDTEGTLVGQDDDESEVKEFED